MAEQLPGVGRVVHYVSMGSPVREDGTQMYESACQAAIITETAWGEAASLVVFNPTGIHFPRVIDHDEITREAGTWHWAQPCLTRNQFTLRAEDLRVDSWREATPNSMCTVRITHKPTGLQASAEEKSQMMAKEAALDALTKLVRLHQLNELVEKNEKS